MRSPYHTVLEPKLIVDRPSEALRNMYSPDQKRLLSSALKGLKVIKPDF